MPQRHRLAVLPLLLALCIAVAGAPRPARALSETLLALAGPLAQQFGVPASSVTSLLESGISLESVTQLLLVSKSSGTGLEDVAELYRESENDVARTAEKLEVDPAEYSQAKVTAAIDQAKAQAQADARKKASDGASKAIDDALGGLKR